MNKLSVWIEPAAIVTAIVAICIIVTLVRPLVMR
jgi:hypothetical protein